MRRSAGRVRAHERCEERSAGRTRRIAARLRSCRRRRRASRRCTLSRAVRDRSRRSSNSGPRAQPGRRRKGSRRGRRRSGASFDDALARSKRDGLSRGRAARRREASRIARRPTTFPTCSTCRRPTTRRRATRCAFSCTAASAARMPAPRTNGIGPLAGAEQIYVLPTAWATAEWWTDRQLENLRAHPRHREAHATTSTKTASCSSGVSDGGTGTYYFSMRDTTPFASFLPLNGAIAGAAQLDRRARRRAVPEQLAEQAVLHRQRRTGSALSDHRSSSRTSDHMSEGRRDGEVPAAARSCPQHGLVARSEGHLRSVRAASTRASRCPTR